MRVYVNGDATAPLPEITAADLNRLPESSVRAILGNVVMVAQHDCGPTARIALAEVRLHMSMVTSKVLGIWGPRP